MAATPSTASQSNELETHRGSCHCQAIVFTVKCPPVVDCGTCDCSHCSKRGIVWGFADGDNFTLEKGRESLQEYAFGPKSYKQLFCRTCGTFIGAGMSAATWAEGGPGSQKIGFNVRALRDIDTHTLTKPLTYHGARRPPVYEPAPPIAHSFPNKSGSDVYFGHCHCKAIQYAVHSKPFDEVEVCDCNCSICSGNGALWLYPLHGAYTFSPNSKAHLVRYVFTPEEDGQNQFFSCDTCGIMIYEGREGSDGIGLNARLLEGADVAARAAQCAVKMDDTRSILPLYEIR